ncbi:prepilin-type N-terminal cleavage/methylation domain-containing protein [Pseudomonas sp. WS 5013]|uniref:prepilin-type N-terminal cleavage/methylation domain-containing protein n=1 Tax=Pseudomonas sp. WS 5013 TaxID=2717475 RepID=UPI001475D2D6|nr:prepilin-type N-terminal cleavage/methylation domain-containing protein [Pseudomonas sp. WS 5013]NMY42295.1 prepilin-type N-terminal cleavage/methylation domain-containing protein [Pseudomonas sp. WS 5013]
MKRQAGMTLVELVITIVIIGIAAAALYSAMAAITGRSADPLLRQQSLSIAEGYLEEILLQPFLDSSNAVCPPPPASRASFDNVCDYNGLNDNGVRDARGQAIAALANYRVQVAVTAQALVGLAASDVLRVRVTVTDPAGQTLALDGIRTRY